MDTSSSVLREGEQRSFARQWALTLVVALCFLLLDVAYVYHGGNLGVEEDLPVRQHQRFQRRRLAETATTAFTNNNKRDKHIEFDETDPHLALFQLSDYTVLGPSQFPEPTKIVQQHLQLQLEGLPNQKNGGVHLSVEVTPILKPVLGSHRPDQDAVFVFASEYDISVYQGFILSLRKTGYMGDIVLAVSPLDMADPSNPKPSARQNALKDFFASDPNVIIYVVPFVCYNAEGQSTDSAKGGMRVCHCHVLYGTRNATLANPDKHIEYSAPDTWDPLDDFRASRPVATTRYELYWIWSRHYQPHTWQMLVDARDTYFQTDPFAAVPREPSLDRQSGVLFFFGENSDATRIGKSDKNRKWLTNAYGTRVIEAMQDKPTICSGATMGEQIALETYLRAMVNEFDETEIKLMGADQGFHNYLYYSGKLQHAQRIRSIAVYDQGRGIVNNMGAMRTAELNEWGNGKMVRDEANNEKTILNWDGTPSPVVHQFDRFKPLSEFVYKRKTKELQKEWKDQHDKEKATR